MNTIFKMQHLQEDGAYQREGVIRGWGLSKGNIFYKSLAGTAALIRGGVL